MKYIAINPDQIECTKCSSRFKADAQFCGFCGASAVRKTIALNAIVQPEDKRKTPIEMEAISLNSGEVFVFEDDDADFDFEQSKKKKIAMGIIATSVFAVGIMSYVLFLQATDRKPTEIASIENVGTKNVEIAVEEKPIKKIEFVMTQKKRTRELRAQGILITINQAKDSRYKSVDKRARSVLIRLNHAMKKVQKSECGTTCFAAVKNGKHSEVRFINNEGAPFRLLDVTKRDARLNKTTPHIGANLIVDQLNALVEIKAQPLAMNLR